MLRSHKSTIMPKLGDLVTCCIQSDMQQHRVRRPFETYEARHHLFTENTQILRQRVNPKDHPLSLIRIQFVIVSRIIFASMRGILSREEHRGSFASLKDLFLSLELNHGNAYRNRNGNVNALYVVQDFRSTRNTDKFTSLQK